MGASTPGSLQRSKWREKRFVAERFGFADGGWAQAGDDPLMQQVMGERMEETWARGDCHLYVKTVVNGMVA